VRDRWLSWEGKVAKLRGIGFQAEKVAKLVMYRWLSWEG
jgi:hypothetical protein